MADSHTAVVVMAWDFAQLTKTEGEECLQRVNDILQWLATEENFNSEVGAILKK